MKAILSIALVASCFVVVPMAACSSSTTSVPGDGTSDAATSSEAGAKDASANDANAGDVKTDAIPNGACNALVNTAPEATTSTIKGNAPTATGGVIVDGTYVLTEFNLYDPAGTDRAPSPSGLKTTLSIKSASMDSIQTLPDNSSDTFAETFGVSGTNLNRIITCPKPGPDLKAVYSVAGTTLNIYETDAKSKLVAGSVYIRK